MCFPLNLVLLHNSYNCFSTQFRKVVTCFWRPDWETHLEELLCPSKTRQLMIIWEYTNHYNFQTNPPWTRRCWGLVFMGFWLCAVVAVGSPLHVAWINSKGKSIGKWLAGLPIWSGFPADFLEILKYQFAAKHWISHKLVYRMENEWGRTQVILGLDTSMSDMVFR